MSTYFIEPSPALLSELGIRGDEDQVVNLNYLRRTNSRFLKKEKVIEIEKRLPEKEMEKIKLFCYLHPENLLVNLRSPLIHPEILIGECKVIHISKIRFFEPELKLVVRDEIKYSEADLNSVKEFKKKLLDTKQQLEKQIALKKSFEKRFEKD